MQCLQLARMKLESLVIADQDVVVNPSPGLAHTAPHVLEVDVARRCGTKPFEPNLGYLPAVSWHICH